MSTPPRVVSHGQVMAHPQCRMRWLPGAVVTSRSEGRPAGPTPRRPTPGFSGADVPGAPPGDAATVEALVHVVAALSAHERRLRHDGAPIPAVFADLTEVLRELVRVRPSATTLGGTAGAAHDAVVTERLLLTKAETAERLSVSVRTVERLVAAGHLPQVSVEGARRFRVADITAYVESLIRIPAVERGATPAEAIADPSEDREPAAVPRPESGPSPR